MNEQRGSHTTRRRFVSIRVKLVIALLLATVPMVALLGYYGIESSSNLLRAQALHNIQMIAMMQARRLEEGVARGIADARFLARSDDILRFAQAAAGPQGPSSETTQRVLSDFAALAEAAGIYCQVRFLDARGRERARVNFDLGRAEAVPEERLQNKSGRGYFRQAIGLRPGQVHVSAIELNREHGQIEQPPRPVMRFCAPVTEGAETFGLVVLNLDAQPLLPGSALPNVTTFTADAGGWYLSHTDPAKAWSGPRNLNTRRSLWTDLGPDARAVVRPDASVLQVGDRLLATWPVLIRTPPRPTYVLLGIEITEDVLFADLRNFRRSFWAFLVISFIVPVVAGLTLAAYFLRPVRKLRRAVHAVAEGNLSAEADVASRDEFHELADDFNTMAARLREYQEQVRWALVGRMMTTIIHDIRNPLGSITVFTRLLGDKQLADDDRQEIADKTVAQVRRILAMLQEILEFSRGEHGQLEPRPISVAKLLEDMKPELEAHCAEHEAELAVEIQGACELKADPEKLRRIVTNITSNALEAMGRGGKLTVRARREGDGVHIEVADTGPGIPEDIADRLFEPFVTHGKSNGTGLGLAISETIAQAHGGHIKGENHPDGGAVFSIWLPASCDGHGAASGDDD